MPAKKSWLIYVLITIVTWGIWGAFIEIPEKAGFPATLGFVVWVFTMIPCAIFALWKNNWKLSTSKRSIILGSIVGLAGAGGQLILFQALKTGPAYLVFPIVSLYPVLTIIMSVTLLKERTNLRHWVGIIAALIAIFFFTYKNGESQTINTNGWLIQTIIVFIAWGVQAYFIKFANNEMDSESIFFYMTVSGIILIPGALYITDFSQPINWGLNGAGMAAGVHILNSIGALTLVYAMRYGKAIIIAPLSGLAPVITVILSLIIYSIVPDSYLITGLIFAFIAIFLISE